MNQNSQTMPNWSESLACDGDGRLVELFYAHLTLGKMVGPEEDYVAHLTRTLPLPDSMREHLSRIEPSRLLLYRRLVRNTHRRVILGAIPKAVARMEDSFEDLFDRFLATRATKSHYLRDITWDFIDCCRNRQTVVLPYIWQLAELEATRIVVAAAQDTPQPQALELELEHGLVLADSAQLLSLTHAVHRLPDDEDDRSLPEAVPTRLLCFRDTRQRVRYLELSPLAAAVVGMLKNGHSLGDAVQTACAELNQALDDNVLSGTAMVLSDLAERGVIRGVAPPAPS